MRFAYDIYRKAGGDKVIWVERVEGLDKAKDRVAHLMASLPAAYLIYDFRERALLPLPPKLKPTFVSQLKEKEDLALSA